MVDMGRYILEQLGNRYEILPASELEEGSEIAGALGYYYLEGGDTFIIRVNETLHYEHPETCNRVTLKEGTVFIVYGELLASSFQVIWVYPFPVPANWRHSGRKECVAKDTGWDSSYMRVPTNALGASRIVAVMMEQASNNEYATRDFSVDGSASHYAQFGMDITTVGEVHGTL